MCGIAGIVLKSRTNLNLSETIVSMAQAIKHRGPDGEGFILATAENIIPYFNSYTNHFKRNDLNYIPKSYIIQSNSDTFLAFAHRRLSIIDLSETGHQPMCDENLKVWITYNGEIYNYIELKKELIKLGHFFVSQSDTEVILKAYIEWGFDCINHFNGMWSFCIYDSEKKICFASRDRLGVKPFYYINNNFLFCFASEQKAFIKSGLINSEINKVALSDYLLNGLLENNVSNFIQNINELLPGKNLIYDIVTHELKTYTYYNLSDEINLKNDSLSEKLLIEKISIAFENSVKIRLRSDVKIGTCLSGGIDSSALAVTISEMMNDSLFCFTSVFKNHLFNEEHFADSIVQKINAKHLKIEPTLEGFIEELDSLVYSQDIPIWDTSTYAQFKVMELAKQNNIKVLLDGQGADELFGGYHHHFIAKWNNLFFNGNYIEGLSDIFKSKKTFSSPLLFFIKEKIKQKKNFNKKHLNQFFKNEFISNSNINNPTLYFNDLNQQLINDIYQVRLKSFLKCEDRCGMWHSVENRTPFADDVELINLLFSFHGNKKIKNGVSKYLLREAVKSKLPNKIYQRYDKKGFETPMQNWIKQIRPQILSEIQNSNFEFVDYKKLERTDTNNIFHNKLLFRLFILSRWQKVFKT